MPARQVDLDQHLDRFVATNVASGRSPNADEVMREALRSLEQRQKDDDLKLERLREAVDAARDDVRQGRVISLQPGEAGTYLARLSGRGSL